MFQKYKLWGTESALGCQKEVRQKTSALIYWQGELFDVVPDAACSDDTLKAFEIRPLAHRADALAQPQTFDWALLRFIVVSALLHLVLVAAAVLIPRSPSSLNTPPRQTPTRGLLSAAAIHAPSLKAPSSIPIQQKDKMPAPVLPSRKRSAKPRRTAVYFKTVIRKAMKDASPQIHRCVRRRALKQGALRSSKLVIEFYVANAQVTNASVVESQSSSFDQETRTCVMRVVSALKLPELEFFTGAKIRYPLNFHTEG